MSVLNNMLDAEKLSQAQYDAIEFAIELATEEFYAEAQRTQVILNELKATGMLH